MIGERRHLGAIVMTALMCILLTGCTWPGHSLNSKEGSDSNNITITVWSKDRHDMEFWFEKVEEYNRTNQDNITVYYQVFSENYAAVIQSRMHTNDAPDLMVYTDKVFTSQRDSYLDLTPYMSEEFRERFSDVLIEDVNVFDGKCYYIPTSATTCRLFYNKTLFERAGIESPPQTMEEMIADAKIITEQFSEEGIYGFAINLKNAESAWNRSIMKQANLQLGLKNGYDFLQGCYDFSGYTSLLSAYRQLLSSECAYPYCDSLDIDPLRILFAKGKIGMYFSYTHAEQGAYIFQYKMTDDWGVAPLPTVNGIKIGAQNYTMNNGWLINAESAHPDEAWKVYESIFANPDNLAEYYAAGLGIPLLPELIPDDQDVQLDSLMLIQPDERLWPRTPDERVGTLMDGLGMDQYELFKTLVLGDADIDSALQELTDQYNVTYESLIRNETIVRLIMPEFDPKEPTLGRWG